MTNDDDDMSLPQQIFWRGMTDQRIAGLFLVADVFNDMTAEGIAFMRSLGDRDKAALRRFLTQARPETLSFLAELRDKEVEDIVAAIETARSIRRTARIVQWGAITMVGAFLGILAVWDKLVLLIRGKS